MPDPLARILLLIAMLLGLGLALWQVLVSPEPTTALPEDAVALVGDTPIWRTDLQRAIDIMRAGASGPPSDEERQRALELLIDEQLLLDYARSTDLQRNSQRLRATVIDELLASAVREVDAMKPPLNAGRDWRKQQARALVDELIRRQRENTRIELRSPP